MFVPSWASVNAAAMTKTPNRSAPLASAERNWDKRSSGFQMTVPNITLEEDDTIMPINEVAAKPIGIVNSCDQRASLGFRANLEKSGSFTIRVAKLAIELMIPPIHPQANFEPDASAGWRTIGPIPWALTMAQIKKAIPAAGTKYALTVKRCRILCTGNQIAGSEPTQKRKKPTKSRVFVPELGMPLGSVLNEGQMERIMSVTHWPPIHD